MYVVIFQAWFMHGVYEELRLVVHRDVLLNEEKVCLLITFKLYSTTSTDAPKHTSPNTHLACGDKVSVDPKAV